MTADSSPERLPDPSILESFDPLEHLLEGNQGIAEVPGHPDVLLRWYPRLRNQQTLDEVITGDELWWLGNAQVLQQKLSKADEEFNKLKALGIPVLEKGVDMVSFIGDAEKVALHGVVQYTIVRRFRGTRLSPSDYRAEPLIESYTEYLSQHEPCDFILHDIFRAPQHLVVDADDGENGRIKLIDVEPIIANVNAELWLPNLSKEKTALEIASLSLSEWAGAANVGPRLSQRIGSLLVKSQTWAKNNLI